MSTNEVAPIPLGEPMWTGEVTLGLCVEVAAGLCRPSEGTVKAIANKAAELMRERDAERWVPVEERKPSDADAVLVTDGKFVDAGYWDGCSWWLVRTDSQNERIPTFPTKWQPFPALPMEQKGEGQ